MIEPKFSQPPQTGRFIRRFDRDKLAINASKTPQIKRARDGDISASDERLLNIRAQALLGRDLTGPSGILKATERFCKRKAVTTRQLQLHNFKAYPVSNISCDYYHAPLTPVGQHQVAVAADKGIYLFDLQSGQDSAIPIPGSYGQDLNATALSVSETGRQFLIGTQSGLVERWDIEAEKLLWTKFQPTESEQCAVAEAQGLIYTAQKDGYLQAWDPRQRRATLTLDLSSFGLCGLSVSPERSKIALGFGNGHLAVYNIKQQMDLNAPALTSKLCQGAATKVQHWVNEKTLLVGTGNADPQLAVVRLRANNTESCVVEKTPTFSQVRHIAVAPHDDAILSLQADGAVKFWRWDCRDERLGLDAKLSEQWTGNAFVQAAQSQSGRLLTVAKGIDKPVVRLWYVREKSGSTSKLPLCIR